MAMISGQCPRHYYMAILYTFQADQNPAQDASAPFSWLEPEFHPRSTAPAAVHLDKSDLQEDKTFTWMTESALWRDWLQGGS